MTAPGTYILGLRQERHRNREVVASLVGISVERQRLIEEGQRIPSLKERRLYAHCFGFASLADFDDGWRGKRIVLSRGDLGGRIPVINLVPAGEPTDYHESYTDSGIGYAYIDPPEGVFGPNLFAFVIFGDSMEPQYPHGYFAICRPMSPEQISDGAAVFVRFGNVRGNGCTFKCCFRIDAQQVELRPINPKYKAQIVDKVDIERMSAVVACIAPGHRAEHGERHYTAEHAQCFDDGAERVDQISGQE
jgi:SOS-response transcriptional repressor LexA